METFTFFTLIVLLKGLDGSSEEFKESNKTFESVKHVSTETSLIFS